MKKFLFATAIVLASLTSCVKLLDTLPLNDYDVTSESAYNDGASYLRGLAYINAYYSFVSMSDPGSADLKFDDAGQSELIRQWITMNDLCTEAMDIGWGDSYIKDIAGHTWTTADNNAFIAVYTRCMKGITLVNEYLLQTTDDKLDSRGHSTYKEDVHRYRAEAKFHRAMFYYILMDLFGNPPFAREENIGGDNLPKQIGRPALCKWIEEELLALTADGSDLAAKGEVAYPRPNKDAAWSLLARLYLNWEVYTGEARWADAKAAAAKVIANGYSIHNNYRELFLQDNGQKCQDEFIFAIDYDAQIARSWGGTTTLSSGAFNDGMNTFLSAYLGATLPDGTPAPHVSAEVWNGYHINPDFIAANAEINGVDFEGAGFSLGFNAATSDARLLICNKGAATGPKDPGAIPFDATNAETGWKCWKWAWMDSEGHVNPRGDKDVPDWKFSSADFAIFRLAEMYYIYAEADARLNGGTTTDATAVGYINEIRAKHGGLAAAASFTVNQILKDKAIDYLWEGQRRQDEIRLGTFDVDKNRWIYPILESDRSANPNLEQNPGY